MFRKTAPVFASRTWRVLLIGAVWTLLPIVGSSAGAGPQGPWGSSEKIDGASGGSAIAAEGGSATVVLATDEGVAAATQIVGESQFSALEQVSAGLPVVDSGIASLGDGRFQAAWVSEDGSIRTATQTIGVGWGAVTQIAGPSETLPSAFELNAGTRGEVCATWNTGGLYGGTIKISCGGPYGGFEVPKSLSPAGGKAAELNASSGPDGTFVVAWSSREQISVAVRNPKGKFGAPYVIKTKGTNIQVSAGLKGDASVAWTNFYRTNTKANLIRRSGKEKKWSKVRIPESKGKETLAVFSLPNGATSLAAMSSEDRRVLVGTVRSGKISKFYPISRDTGGVSQFPDSSVADNGTINMIWNTNFDKVVVATKLPSGPFWSTEIMSDEYGGAPVVVADNSGHAFASWTTGGEYLGDPIFVNVAHAGPDITYCRREPFKVLRKQQNGTKPIELKILGIQAGIVYVRGTGLSKGARIRLIEAETSVLKVPLTAKAKRRLSRGRGAEIRLRLLFRSSFGCKSKSIAIRVRLDAI